MGSRVVDVTLDNRNRVSQVRDTGVSSSWRTYSHDARGNVTADVGGELLIPLAEIQVDGQDRVGLFLALGDEIVKVLVG